MKRNISFLDRIARTIERRGMFSPGQKVGVAVSGGADSVCLLHALVELAPRWDLCLTVLHLDHQLRGEESRADAEFVAHSVGKLGRRSESKRAEGARKCNLEQNARNARRTFFEEAIASGEVE